MNVTDRAFIKAYGWDEAEASPPSPHLIFAPASAGADPSQHVAESGQYDALSERDRSMHSSGQRRQQRRDETPASPEKVAKVTHYVPAPHISMHQFYQSRTSPRHSFPFGQQVASTEQVVQDSQPQGNTSAPQVADKQCFEPALGVPYFQWPEVCQSLDRHSPPDYTGLIDALIQQAVPAHLLAVTGVYRGEGRTTMLLSLAQEFVRQGLKTIVVDADFSRPSLAEQLGVAQTTGWEGVLSGRVELAEAVVYSEQDRLSLLPLGEVARDRHALASSPLVGISLSHLLQHYHAVLVDAGPMLEEPQSAQTLLRRARFTSALFVHDARRNPTSELTDAAARLAAWSIPVLGVAENFSRMNAGAASAERTSAA